MQANDQQNRIPNTDVLRDNLTESILTTVKNGENTVFRVATSVGKTHTVATTNWSTYPDLTGGKPVIHLHPTHEARDEAIETSRKEGLRAAALYGREEYSSILKGKYDQQISINGLPVSEWIDRRCTRDGFQFSDAIRLAEQESSQSLPWGKEDDNQWGKLLPLDKTRCEIIHATHQFAYAPPLRNDTVVFFDERPNFTRNLTENSEGLTQDRIRRAVTAFLQEAGAGITYEGLVTLRKPNSARGARGQWISEFIGYEPDVDWFVRNDNAHVLSPAFVKAIYQAKQRSNGRIVGTAKYSPPRISSSSNSGPDAVVVTIVLDENNTLRTCRIVPYLGKTRVVIGLDAFPVLPLWQLNVGLDMMEKQLVSVAKRRLWRYHTRGLNVVRVGNNANVYTHGGLNEPKVRCLIQKLHQDYKGDFRTCITTKAVRESIEDIMRGVGIQNPRVMHYGEQSSRNDFGDENVGLVLGCIDPGDESVLDRLAELDLDANPERSNTDCSQCNGLGCSQCDETGKERAEGRGFNNSDGEVAERINGAVRRGEVSQAICRYARNPDVPEDTATVFVATNAVYSAELVDKRVPGVTKVFTQKEREIIDFARGQSSTTAPEIQSATSSGRAHVTNTLNQLVKEGYASVEKGKGRHGCHVYHVDEDTPMDGIVRL